MLEQNILTDNDGKVYLELADILPGADYHEMYVESELNDDTYYTIIKATTRSGSQINATASKTTYHSNSTINVNVTQGATGNVSVYVGDKFITNITLNNSKGSINISTLVEDAYLPAGNHTLSFVYNGNVKYDKSNTTAVLEITKITPVMLLNVTGIGYNLLVNVTVMDGEYNITDATGNVTIQVEDRTATIYLGNGQGMTIIYGLPIGNYTVNATYSGDNNYYSIDNSTEANVTEKTQTVLVLDVDSEKVYYINETVPIKVTILPEGEGNVTLYINGIPHELTLQTLNNSTFVEFNATDLKDGINYVFATYEGTEIYAPSWAQDRFNVIKYNATIGIETDTITFKGTEIINITLPEDAEGIIKVLINDTPYLVELVNGTAQLNISDLAVGTYNVTVIFNEDKKYYNATNSTLFNVTKIKPSIQIDANNVTYGNETVISVTLPEGVTGNVTIKVNDTIRVYEEQEIVDGKVILPGTILGAGNYTVEVTYNGDGNYSLNTTQANFTVYGASPTINVTVEDINYGENVNITVEVPSGVTGTIIIKVNGTESEPLTITDGKVNLSVEGLAAGNYPVEVIYSGNDNYTDTTVVADFNVFQIGTELDVDVHEVTVWDEEYINITIKDTSGAVITNATGNVTININGVNHTAEIKDGIARFNTSDLAVGHKVVWVFYDGDRNLTGSKAMAEFEVGQRTPVINITAQNIIVGQLGNITVNVPVNATGFVVIEVVGDDTYFRFVSQGKATVNPKDLKVGSYTVKATYYGGGNDNYTVVNAEDVTFTVSKLNATVTVDVDDINYTETAVITVSVPEGVSGNITIKLNDTAETNVTKTIVDGTAIFEIPDLAAGNYTVNVTYNGNDDYNINDTESAEFEVKKIDPNLQISSVTSVTGETAEIVITIDDRIDAEYVTITGLDKEYTKEIVNGVVSFITDGPLEFTEYTMTVTYGGNQNFTESTKLFTFKPDKISDYEINVTGTNITVNDDEIITVKVPAGVTNVSIWVNGTKYINDSFTNGEAKFNITGLKEGVYTVNATVNDENYTSKVATNFFKVSKTYPTLNITVINDTSIYVGDTVKVVVTVPEDATEDVSIEINGISFTNSTVDGNATFYVPAITYGNKTIVATYPGDDKYFFNSTTANFTVNKRTPSIVVSTDGPIGVGENITITVDIPANATGYVVVNVNGTNYTINVTNGDYSVEISGLGEGTWNVTATYIGDDQYLPNVNTTSFDVNKVESTIVIDVESIDYGNKANITVTVKNDATGYITIRINETRNITLPVVKGKVNWIVDGLAADNYTVYANYSGNDKYNENRTDKSFEVRQISPEIEIINVISTADDNATVIVKIDPRVTENVTVTVEGIPYSKAADENGIVVITTDKLNYGEYTITASYPGDKNFTTDSDTYEFTTNKTSDYLINITASDIKVGNNTNITVKVPSDATGKVIIELNGTNYTCDINDGVAVLNNISTLKEGIYNVTAYFGNDKYENKTVQTIFEVSKVDIPIKVDIDDIYVGDTALINVTLEDDATGTVTIEINGESYSPVSFENGVAKFEVPNVTYGNKTVAVTYSGNDKYATNFTTANFTVNKRTPGIVVSTDGPIGVGENITITVDIPANATGYVVVNVNGTNYTINVTNGDYSVEIPNLSKGTWNVTATYIGDDQYLPNVNTTSFDVNKVESTIVIDVESIDYGNKANITVTVKNDATGYITIRINETRNITLPVADGKVNWIVDGLAADNYTVYANYSGDAKYNVNETSETFEVRQISPEIKIVTVISTAGDNATIIVKVDSRVTENVTVTVNNKPYTKAVDENGIAVIVTEVLDYGTYTVDASYVGDKNFTADEDSLDFTTNATDDYLISITASDIKVGDNTNITVNVPSDATGKVIIELNGTNYTCAIEGGVAVLNNISTLKEGVYNVTAYFGNDKYVNKTVETRFTVAKVDNPITITIINDTSIYVGDTVKVVVTVPEDATEDVTIEINGQKFSNSTVDGNATFYVPAVTYGNKTVVATYPGDDKYVFNSTTANFTVNKRESSVNVTVEPGIVGGETVINVTIPANATGYVIVNVDGTNYAVNTTNGNGSVTIKGLGNTTHTVDVTYIGDDQYLPNTNSTTFGIAKANTTIEITVESIDYGQSANITVKVLNDATGYITIRINETRNITLPIADGKVNWIVDGLAADNYTVYANYSGDAKYNVNETSETFEVRQISPEIKIISVISEAGKNATIIVQIDPRVTENVAINVDKEYSVKPENGIAVLITDVLDYGTYTITASYPGDKNFTADEDSLDFTTNATDDYLINITASDIKVGNNTNITVNVPSDAIGKVIIELNGTNYTCDIEGGVAVLNNISTLKEGVYNVTAYFGNDKYVNKTVETRFTVTKVDYPIEITVINETGIYVGDTVKVVVTVPEDATEDVTIEIDGQKFSNSTVDGNATFYVPAVTYGNKTVVATYPGDDKYVFNATTSNFTVSKRQSQINVTATGANVGENATITVQIPANATGYVIVNVDGTNYTINTTDGEGSIEIANLGNKTYTVKATYIGDDQYLASENNTVSFTMNKIQPAIVIEGKDIIFGQDEVISIELDQNITGIITVEINGNNYTAFVVEGKGNLTVSGLHPDNYEAVAYYGGDDMFLNATSNVATFKVNETSDLDIVIEVQNITFGDKETITVYINATGTLNITVDDVPYDNLEIQDGKVILEVPGYLTAGNYTVYVDYSGNEDYTNKSASENFTVAKADPIITIEVQNITYGDTEHIIVHVNAEGNVSITTAGNSTTIVLGEQATWILRATIDAVPQYNGEAIWNIGNLPAGIYPVEATYNGNDNYNSATVNAVFIVSKQNTTVSVEVEDIRVDGKEVINVTLSNTNATGNVTINVDGKNYTEILEDGKATLTLDKLSNATHSVVVIYEGDDNFNGNWTSATFNVTKVKPTLTIDAANNPVGETELITIHLPENATGYVVVDVDGIKYHVDIVEGEDITLEVPKLENKTYEVSAHYSGDGFYDVADNDTSFNVSKVESEVTVKVENITVGDVEAINITVTTGATGNVTIKIGDEYEQTAGVTDGVISVIVPGLTVGNKTVEVTYNGNDKYLPSNVSAEFKVIKINTTDVDIKVVDQGNGTVVVIVPENATGNITIRVNGTDFTGNITNGTAIITLDNVTPGVHDIEVIYSGDGNYTNATADATVHIPKLESPIKVDVSDIYVGDAALINVTLPENATGKVTIEINGKVYEPTAVEDNVARFEVDDLTFGNKTVAVRFYGDDTYVENSTTANFTVSKRESQVNVTAESTVVGEDSIISVVIPEDAGGYVVVSVDGVNYTINTTDCHGSVVVKELGNSTHEVKVTYLGDDKYLSSTNETSFGVDKVESFVEVSVDNITVGDKAIINIKVPTDATGNVTTVIVNGETYTVPIANGTGMLVVDGLGVDEYVVEVTYNGDDKYLTNSNKTTFKVSKEITNDIKVIDQGNGTVVVVVPDNATGNVTITVNGTNFTGEVINGTAVINLTNVTPGVHDIEVVYSGDENHTNATVPGTVTIPKYATPIDVNVTGIYVGDKALINVTLPENATGMVVIEIDGKSYNTTDIVDGIARFTIENLTYGNKTVCVTYLGDDNYVENHTSGNFSVDKRVPTVQVDVEPIDVGETAVVTVSVPENATGYAIVEIDNQTYAVKVTDGTGVVKIKGLPSGEIPINVTYLGDDQYFENSNSSSVVVSKVPSTISVAAENITVGDKEIITITVPEDICGNVTVTVDGKNYTVPVSNGKGTLVIPDLEAGNYTVDAIFDGCKKYEPSNTTSKFTVSKEKSNIKVIDQNNGTVTVIVDDNATGNVTVKVGNETYNATVVNGTAVITLTNASPGIHDIEVIYSGDGTHEGATVNSTVTIPKVETPISVDVEDISVGETATIVVNVPDDATGNVTIEIDGVKYTEEIKDGKATFNIDNLTAGTKTISVDYPGDDTYLGNHTTADITVSKVPSTVNVEIDDCNVGDNVTVKVTVPDDATGQVLIDIGGVGYYVNVTDGTGSIQIPRIPSGKYPVNVTYIGDDKYLPSSNSTTFDVNKVPSFVIPTAQDIQVGDNEVIRLVVPSDATGTVTVVIDGSEYNFNLDDGTLGTPDGTGDKYSVAVSGGNGILVVSGLPKGEYVVSVRYNGDDKYLPAVNETTFTVSKKSTDLDVIDQGNGTVVVVLPENATGTVTVKVGNETYNATVVNGTAVITLENATPGTHDIEVVYSGDDEYGSKAVNSTVVIPKHDTPISVEVEDIDVGDTAKITVTVPDGATGSVTIEINGKEYTADIKDGKAVFEVPDLAAGDKTVAVKYAGDDSYVENFTTANFTVSKVPSTVTATSKDIKVGKDEIITVTVPNGATGRVLVDIDGVGYYADIVNGKAKVIVPELPSGKYTAKVTYEGDDKYLPSTTTTKFTVTKNPAPIKATGDEIEQGEDATIVVKVPSDATGTVSITVDGKKYTAEVKDGKAVFTIPGLTKGDHDITARYSGDKKYEANETVTDIEVYYDEPEPSPDYPEDNVEYGEGVNLSIYATGNPIWILLLVLLTLASTKLRRFRK